MAKLVLSMDGLVLKEMPLTKARTTIGRKPHNDIQIDNLAISGEHAAIVRILEDAFLEDLNSTNGTYVNGQPVRKHILRGDDIIEIGKYRIKYVLDQPVASADYDKAMALEMTPAQASPEPAAAAPEPAPAKPAPVGLVRIQNGVNKGRELELAKSVTTLGKPGVQVAVITRRPQGYFLTHVEGNEFPLLNGAPIDARAQLLADHDVIQLAGVRMEFIVRA
jgi:pSer/pThr/pTyr-binding forkhead associated (FHA) protein